MEDRDTHLSHSEPGSKLTPAAMDSEGNENREATPVGFHFVIANNGHLKKLHLTWRACTHIQESFAGSFVLQCEEERLLYCDSLGGAQVIRAVHCIHNVRTPRGLSCRDLW